MVQFCYLQLYIVGHYRKRFPAVSCYEWQGHGLKPIFFFLRCDAIPCKSHQKIIVVVNVPDDICLICSS